MARSLHPHVAVDVGCGEGRNLAFLRSISSVRRILALDISHSALDRACSTVRGAGAGAQVDLICANCMQMPLGQGVADLLLASDLLNHILSWTDAIGEFARILRPGGVLICNPLSVNDPAYRSVEGCGQVVGPRAFLVCPPQGAQSGSGYIMKFAERLEVEEILANRFRTVFPVEECERVDPPPGPPLNQQEHRHVYWRVVCERV